MDSATVSSVRSDEEQDVDEQQNSTHHDQETDNSGDSTSPTDILTPTEAPSYMCPSSEEKSKQAAVRQWIVTSNFLCAPDNVPLL